jgi:hypothetical protein
MAKSRLIACILAACLAEHGFAQQGTEDSSQEGRAQVDDGDDTPQKFEIFPYLGLAIDNFAASEVRDYLNFEVSGESKSRETFGIAFQYPLIGSLHHDLSTSDAAGSEEAVTKRFGTLTVYGQTTHGVRSTDIDCEAAPDTPLCIPFGPEILAAQNDPTQRALFILRNSSSLEAMLGLRYEFLKLQEGDAALYAAVQAGFVAVEDDDDDVADINHVAIGARIRQGRYRDSYLEVAKGENDLFADHPNDRSKIIARLVTRPTFFKSKAILFAHIVTDVDGDEGADSVQTYFGIAFCFLGNNHAGCRGPQTLR